MNITCASLLILTLGALLAPAAVAGEKPIPGLGATNPPSVFALPALLEHGQALQAAMMAQLKAGNLEEAAQLCERMIRELPFGVDGYYNLGCIRAVQGRADEAFKALDEAVERGYLDTEHLARDPDLKGLRRDARFKALTEKASHLRAKALAAATNAPPPGVAIASNGVVWVSASNTVWDGRNGLLVSSFDLGPTNATPLPIHAGQGEAANLLRTWWQEGTAAGNRGDFYDNRDSDHSNMAYQQFPQLTRIEYAPEAIAHGLHYGCQLHLFHRGRILGNSSTANTSGPFWRSQTRTLYASPRGVAMLSLQYLNSQLYFYPEHRDHDPGHNGKDGGFGDVFFCNTPYLITSQGSSGSDQAFMNAIASTLAAFRPDVKTLLSTNGMLMPTVQRIFRASNSGITNDAAYLSGDAHPVVFDSARLDVVRMVRMAHDMTPATVPPLVLVNVEKEDRFKPGQDYFDAANEVIFDSPCAIARVWRATAMTRTLVVSAAHSRDLTGRTLTYRWVVLQGDPSKIRIRPLDKAGTRAELTLTWQGRHPVAPGAKLESNRIDIGVFAHNGAGYSAPAFISYYTLDNEERTYDASGHIAEIRYTGANEPGNYTDPLLDRPKSWRDVYRYDASGKLAGWTRHQGDKVLDFAPDGNLVVRRDANGKVIESRPVSYALKPGADPQTSVLVTITEAPLTP